MKKPVIGVAGDLYTELNLPFVGNEYDYLNQNYTKAIHKAGGIPIYIPVTTDGTLIESQLALCDGLLMPGGGDIHPSYFNEDPLPLLGTVNVTSDIFQMTLLKCALQQNVPILAICRGAQLLNVATGGTLYQDLSYCNTQLIQHRQKSRAHHSTHSVSIEEESFLFQLFGHKTNVNSFHHQAIRDVGEHTRITAVSSDGIVEAIEVDSTRFALGVQWHPEAMLNKDNTMLPLFSLFVSQCEKKR